MKRKLFLMACALLALCLSGCAKETASKDPTEEELRTAYQSALEDWAENQSFLTIDRVSVDRLELDPLLTDELRNAKRYNNAYLDVGIYFDPAQFGDGSSLAPELEAIGALYDPVMNALRNGVEDYEFLKLRELTVYCYTLDGRLRNEEPVRTTEVARIKNPDPGMTRDQPKEELYAQTIAYEMAKDFNAEIFGRSSFYYPYGEIFLRRFGIRPGSGELYIEIGDYTLGGENGTEQAAFIASLEGRSRALADDLLADKRVLRYLEDSGADSIAVAFWTPWEKQGDYFYAYTYEVK